jgi:hypothetical protein
MSLTDRIDSHTAGIGALAGVSAYLGGYLVAYLTQRGSIEERLEGFNVLLELLGGDPIPAWQAVGWLYYNAHGVATSVPGFAGSRTINILAEEGSLAWLYLLPPALLVVAGFVNAYRSGARSPGPSGAVGALVVVGYLPLAVLGIVVFGYGVGDGTIAPDAVTAVLLAGIVYPVGLGALGGVLGGRV